MSELEPRLFSFNNPHGACPGCDGLGNKQFFDPDRVVTHPQLSLATGAMRGWDRRNAYYYQMIQALADHYGFDPEAPYANLPQRARDVLMHGSGGEEDRVPLLRLARPHHPAQARSRASCPTSSVAITKPNPWRCARNSRATSARAAARSATARA